MEKRQSAISIEDILSSYPNWLKIKAKTKLTPPKLGSLEEKISYLREQKIGRFSLLPGPTLIENQENWLPLLHLDYTASAQSLEFIEKYILELMESYANTHTSSSATGRISTERLATALKSIKSHVGAGDEAFVLATGYGATGAIERIQKILGLYISPRAQKIASKVSGIDLKEAMKRHYLVLVGPAEHHSNDVSWQDDAMCEFVRVQALKSGLQKNQMDLEDLERQLQRFPNHVKFLSISAASNVTGMKAPLKEISKLVKRYNCYFLVDYAAAGPYTEIKMKEDGIDAIFISAHKNIGGTNLGLLIGHERLYDMHSNPSFGGGGTVSAVTPWEYHFNETIEEREFPGTPAIRQIWQSALSFQIKEWIGYSELERIEEALSKRFMEFFTQHPRLEVLGNQDPHLRYPIFSFLVKHADKHLHHSLVASLLNDIFGVQSRAGCACAGPFGHELLGIEKSQSQKFVKVIEQVLNGFKPGWTRIAAHYTMSEDEINYTFQAINAIAWFGGLFIEDYSFDPYKGEWQHLNASSNPANFHIKDALSGENPWPKLENETERLELFERQIASCSYLIAKKISQLVGEELTKSFYPMILDHIQSGFVSIDSLIEDLIEVYQKQCSRTFALSKENFKSLIFGEALDQYESYEGLLKEIQFFYVKKSHPCISAHTLMALGKQSDHKKLSSTCKSSFA